MVVEDFSSKTVFLDTAPLIYFIEGHSKYQEVLVRIFALNDEGRFEFLTSCILLLEVLVKPLREGKQFLAQQYRDILTKSKGIEMLDVFSFIAEKGAELRAKYNLRTPDAIQLAAAILWNCDYFLTHDTRLKVVTEITVVTLDEIQP